VTVVRAKTPIRRRHPPIEPVGPTLLDARTKAQADGREARVRAAETTQKQSHSLLKQRSDALELARHDFDRARKLMKSNAISPPDFDRADEKILNGISLGDRLIFHPTDNVRDGKRVGALRR
jgi:hypothetical protein